MGIFSRFADIVNANINALLDKAEDPEKLIRVIVQEMEDTLVEVRTASARALADKKELVRRVELLNHEAEEWESKAELAISKGREDLAKAALIERNKSREAAAEVESELAKVEESIEKLSVEIEQLQAKLDDAKARQKALLLRHKTSSARLKVKKGIQLTSSASAMEKFAQFERKLDNLESEAEAMDIGRNSNLASEIDDLVRDEEIDQQLAELRARVKNKHRDEEKD